MSVPEVRLVDVREGVLGLEWIEGKSVRALLGGGAEDEDDDDVEGEEEAEEQEEEDPLKEYGITRGMGHFVSWISNLSSICLLYSVRKIPSWG